MIYVSLAAQGPPRIDTGDLLKGPRLVGATRRPLRRLATRDPRAFRRWATGDAAGSRRYY